MEDQSQEKEPKGFAKAKQKAKQILGDDKKLDKLLREGEAKANSKKEKLKGVWIQFQTLLRLLKAWWKKEYDQVPWKTILYIVTSVLYFINPFDLIPDFIPMTGLIDDVTIITFVIHSLKEDIEKFTNWEKEKSISEEDQ
jgi:uncharacterized membrane protein YkvA (DUF1232 family)